MVLETGFDYRVEIPFKKYLTRPAKLLRFTTISRKKTGDFFQVIASLQGFNLAFRSYLATGTVRLEVYTFLQSDRMF